MINDRIIFLVLFLLLLALFLDSYIIYHANNASISYSIRGIHDGLIPTTNLCFGYEDNCSTTSQVKITSNPDQPKCEGSSQPWAKTLEEKTKKFWYQADFGYVKQERDSMQNYCFNANPNLKNNSNNKNNSYVRCNKNMRYCFSEYLHLDLTHYDFSGRERFLDLPEAISISAECDINQTFLINNIQHTGALQSWSSELKHLKVSPSFGKCDFTFSRPVVFMKLDAGINMYHHFCDFINLYASLHVNGSIFDRDIHIIIWDMSNFVYRDFFDSTWRVFTKHSVKSLSEYKGMKLCFANAMFALPSRMFYGLFYNMPLIPECYGSSLMQAFSKFILTGLGVHRTIPFNIDKNSIHITLIDRNTKYRNILNQDQLIRAMKTIFYLNITLIEFNPFKIPFTEQLQHVANTDIFITMHGSGLTHLLFLPDWGVVIELYNCDDIGCYRDLASIRGVKYMTWSEMDKIYPEDEGHHPTLGPHKKFTNYAFDVSAFMRLILRAVDYVSIQKQFLIRMRDEL